MYWSKHYFLLCFSSKFTDSLSTFFLWIFVKLFPNFYCKCLLWSWNIVDDVNVVVFCYFIDWFVAVVWTIISTWTISCENCQCIASIAFVMKQICTNSLLKQLTIEIIMDWECGPEFKCLLCASTTTNHHHSYSPKHHTCFCFRCCRWYDMIW